jgi:hypothetical protein
VIRRNAKVASKKKAPTGRKDLKKRVGGRAERVLEFDWGRVVIGRGQRPNLTSLFPIQAAQVIDIVSGEASPEVQRLHFGGPVDRVAWYNKDPVGYTIHFELEDWPFVESWCNFAAPAGQFSATFTVKDTGKETPVRFVYKIWGAGSGPGEPEVVTEP